ncbi:MAG: hypothetical protein ABI469_02180 [Gemmatimonadales bacterium]
MPDLDILGKGIPSCFRESYRLICGGAADDDVLDGCRRGLSLALKRGGGIPGLGARAGLVVAVSGGVDALDAVSGSRALLVTEAGSRHAHLAHRSLQRLLIRGDLPTSTAEAERVLAEYLCREVLDHLLFSKLGVEFSTLGPTNEEFQTYRTRVLDGLEGPIATFARQLVTDPSGASIQAPPLRRRPRPSTAALLAEVVG